MIVPPYPIELDASESELLTLMMASVEAINRPPSLVDMSNLLGYSGGSTTQIRRILDRLHEKGYVKKEDYSHLGYVVLRNPEGELVRCVWEVAA